jgi:hypothetical protein
MIRSLAMAALLATAIAMPAMAEESSPKPDREAMKAERFQEMKAKHAEMHEKREEKIKERRAEWDSHREDCFKKMQSADTPEKAKYVREQCKSEGKAMHEKNKAERDAWKAKREAKKDEWKAKRAERKAKNEGSAE